MPTRQIIILITLICITFAGCDNKKEVKKDIIKTVSKSSVNNAVSHSHGKHDCAVCSKAGKKNTELSSSDIEKELMEYEKQIEFAMSSDEIVNSKELESVLEKSIQFWNESDWAVFKTQFDFNNTNNMEKLENIYSKLSCTAHSFNKATREKIINNLNDIAEKIYKPTMRHLINYICGDLYWRGKDYDNAILFADILYNDCLKNKDIDMVSTSVTLKMKSYLKQNQPENIAPLVQQWEKDFPDSDFNNYFRINLFSVKAYFAVDVNEKVNELKGIKVLVSLLNDNRLNEKQKRKTESLYESYKELPVCAEYLNNLTVKRR